MAKRYLTLKPRVAASDRPYHPSMQHTYEKPLERVEPKSRLSEEQIKYLINFPESDGVPRAVRWAWFELPKSYWDEERQTFIRITKIEQRTFNFLKKWKKMYYRFLEEHGLQQNVYDRFIGTPEPEVRTTW